MTDIELTEEKEPIEETEKKPKPKQKRDSRTQAKKLEVGDQLKLKDILGRLQVTEVLQNDTNLVRLTVKLVPCSGKCNLECHCLYQRFDHHSNALPLQMKPEGWVSYYGNLDSLNQKKKELLKQIELLEATQLMEETTQTTEEAPQFEEQPIA